MKSSSSNVEMKQFFRLSDPLATRPMRLTTLDDPGDNISVELALALTRGETTIDRPLVLKAYQGRQPADFLWCALTPIKCVADRVVDLMQTHTFTGWSTYPVKVYDRNSQPVEGYRGLSITGRAGRADRTKSLLIDKPPRVQGGKPYQVYRGLVFDLTTWSGSDFFFGAGTLLVTERVYNVFRRAKISNVRFTNATEVEIPTYIAEMSH